VASLPSAEKPAAAVTSARHPLALFFDGECCFCNRWVGRVMRADSAHRTRFGAKQGRTFQRVAQQFPEAANVESIVLLRREPDGQEHVLVRRAAILAVIDGLPGYGFFTAVLRLTPRPLSELGYFIFSRMRKSIFGTQNVCNVVKPEERELFLD
jgi:predicted DCC family thiol-disulfide oxidoreductase YuxK